jgi:lipopolysaccharide export system permease protein
LIAWGRQINAADALQIPATKDHPAGYLLRRVSQPANLPELRTASLDDQPVLIGPADAAWLRPDECFVVSVVDFQRLAAGNGWRQYLSTWELLRGVRNESIEAGADVRLTLHGRLVQPLLDISLVLLGVPLVLTRGSRNIFWAATTGVLLVATLYVVVLVCRGLGLNYLLSSTLAAWLPLLVFGPIAYVLARRMWD